MGETYKKIYFWVTSHFKLWYWHICIYACFLKSNKLNLQKNSIFEWPVTLKGWIFEVKNPKCNFSYLDSWLISSQQFQTHWHWDLNFRRFRIFSNIIKAGRRNILDNKTGLNREIMWNDKKMSPAEKFFIRIFLIQRHTYCKKNLFCKSNSPLIFLEKGVSMHNVY